MRIFAVVMNLVAACIWFANYFTTNKKIYLAPVAIHFALIALLILWA